MYNNGDIVRIRIDNKYAYPSVDAVIVGYDTEISFNYKIKFYGREHWCDIGSFYTQKQLMELRKQKLERILK